MINLITQFIIVILVFGLLIFISQLFNGNKKQAVYLKNNVRKNSLKEDYNLIDIDRNKKNTDEKKSHLLYYSNKTRRLFELTSSNYLYYISVYDSDLNFLYEIETYKETTYEGSEIILKTAEQNDNEIIILAYRLRDTTYYYQFDDKGENIYEKSFVTPSEIILIYHNRDEFTSIKTSDGNYAVTMYWIENETSFSIDLVDMDQYYEKDWGSYEYIESITQTNRPNQFAMVCTHTNWGVSGIQIFQLGKSIINSIFFDLDILFDRGHFSSVTFSIDGNKFAILLHTTSISKILEYSVLNASQPINTIETSYLYEFNSGRIDKHYITDKLFCIIRDRDIIIYDLESNTQQRIINRDLKSPYTVNLNIVVYQQNGKKHTVRYS